MKIETIEEKINLRANENVQAKIKAFKLAITAAMKALFGPGHCKYQFGEASFADDENRKKEKTLDDYRAYSAVLRLAGKDSVDHKALPWPTVLWDIERELVRNDLMEKMDLMQKLLMTKDGGNEGDVMPDEHVNQ